MKNFFYLILSFLIVDLTVQSCANIGRPTGGPKDTIPPTLTYSIPQTGTTNYDNEELILEFSEFINDDKLKQQLIITPKTDIQYNSVAKRNKLVIKLDTKLADSTTYNFNFADGVTDITENNPATNLSIAFSTGPYIDSLAITGFVRELLTDEPAKKYVVGLYPLSDSLDYFATNPMYFTTTNDSGRYAINYIKRGKYKIISFKDENANYLLDPESESHGFLQDTINLDSSLSLKPIRCILQNVKPIEMMNYRSIGPYVEIKFNKSPDAYSIKPDYLNHHIVGDKKDIIRIYKHSSIAYNDSLQTTLIAYDSLQNKIEENIKIVFLESSRKKAKFSVTIKPTNLDIYKDKTLNLSFNKPVISYDSTNLSIKSDSIFTYPLSAEFSWNTNHTELELKLKVKHDSVYNHFEKLLQKDSAERDTSVNSNTISSQNNSRKLQIEIPEGMFTSVERDSSSLTTITINKKPKPSSGVLKLAISTTQNNYFLQILNDKGQVKYSISNQKTETFDSIIPGNYTIRVLIDDNNDGNWSYGNLLKNEEPETVYIHPEEISIRENWIVEMGISF
ncbi:Ig-like domain-containing domain [Ekhidna sp.]|uniref:Ig-like domain-containing domain n=1 Tax=Ekhidna sp. TaxID=2608089 RepID=UPI003BAA983B